MNFCKNEGKVKTTIFFTKDKVSLEWLNQRLGHISTSLPLAVDTADFGKYIYLGVYSDSLCTSW